MAKITNKKMNTDQPFSSIWVVRLLVILLVILALVAGYYFDLSKVLV
jgi:hypothetical protein